MISPDISVFLISVSQYLFVISALLFALSAIDDTYFDARFYLGRLWRLNQTEPTNKGKPQQWFAIMVPAWQESGVLLNAVANMVNSLDYERVHIFVGTYPNDPATMQVAEKLAQQFPNVHKVVTQTAGPTCKADCLNHILERIWLFEKRHKIEFAAAILQDAEDVLHPELLHHFNSKIPEYDIVQVPVYSLPRPWYALTAGHYMDEFAESHSKDLFTRQSMTQVVPGAGVGTAYSRKALLKASESGTCFNTDSLTEDYEFSLRLRHAGLKHLFSRCQLAGANRGENHRFIATRELFPSTFWASVRQKTRWNLGIAFQGWQHFGWDGNAEMRYLFFRDRKVIAMALASLAGIVSMFCWWGSQLLGPSLESGYHLPPFLNEGNSLWWLVYINTAAIASRLIQRAYWTWDVYGFRALPALPLRFFWSGVINQAAAMRSIHQFVDYKFKNRPLGWDKTRHDFPEIDGLESLHHRLGEDLIKARLITQAQLTQALKTQQETQEQLGKILMQSGTISEPQLMKTLGKKYRLQTEDIDPFQIPAEMYQVMPFELMRKHQVIPVRWDENVLELATAQILCTDAQEEIECYLEKPVRLMLVTQASLFFALHTFSRLAQKRQPNTSTHFSTRLLKTTDEVSPPKSPSRSLASYMPFGQYLIKSGHLTPKSLESALADAAAADKTLGQYLVDQGLLSNEERDKIVLRIENQYRSIVTEYLGSLEHHNKREPPKKAQG